MRGFLGNITNIFRSDGEEIIFLLCPFALRISMGFSNSKAKSNFSGFSRDHYTVPQIIPQIALESGMQKK